MNVTVTLDSNIGADLGPFTLAANTGSISPTQATRQQLLDGLEVTVDEAATSVTVTSTGVCTNSVELTIQDIPIIIAAIYALQGGTSCLNGDPTSSFSNILWVPANWDGFRFNANNKLVLDNGPLFAGSPTQYYNPTASNVSRSSNSITDSTLSFIDPTNQGDKFLVQEQSLFKTITQNEDKVDFTTDPILTEVSFATCFS